MQTIRTPDGQVFKFPDTMSRAQIAEALKRRLGNQSTQPNQQPVTGDTSFGTALKVGQAQSESLGQSGAASLQRNLSQGIFGDAQRYLTENIANPVRELVGKEPIDIDAVNQAETKRLEKAAELSAEAAQKLQDDLNFQNLTTGDIRDIPSFVNFVSQKTAQALPYMGAALASGGTLTYPFGVGEISQSLDEIKGLDQAQKDDIAATGGAIMAVLENLGIAKLLPDGVSTSVIGGISKGFITEGTTEGLQELVVIGSEAVAGKEFTQEEIINRLKESVAAGGAVGSSIKAASNTATKLKSVFTSDGKLVDPNSLDADQKQTAASVAQLLRQIADQNGYNLKNVNASSDKGAKKALEGTRRYILDRLAVVEEDDEEDELERVRRERDEARQQLEEARALLLASSCPRAETSADERPAGVVLAPRIGQDQQRDESGDKDYVEFSELAGEDYDSYAFPAEVEEHTHVPEIAGQDVGTRLATAEEDGEYEEGEAEFEEFFDIP